MTEGDISVSVSEERRPRWMPHIAFRPWRVLRLRHRDGKPSAPLIPWAVVVIAILYAIYRFVDPVPPRRFTMAAGIEGSEYGKLARQYQRVLARDGVDLNLRYYAGAAEHFEVLRDGHSGVQAALTTFGLAEPADAGNLYSLGGISDSPIFILYRSAAPITQFAQFRGKRLFIGKPPTAIRALMLQVLKATGALEASTRLVDLGHAEAIDALITGKIDAAMFPIPLDESLLHALKTPGIRLMNVAQAEAIAKTVPGLKHVVLWRGLINLNQDIPHSDVNLLAVRNRILVRKELHPALQYLLLEAMREIHAAPGPFNRLGEFPAEQPNDLPLSPTAEAFYRSGPTFLQRYTSFWLTSLLNRVVFFVIPASAILIPFIGFAFRFYKWLYVRRIDQLHQALGTLERDLARGVDSSRFVEYRERVEKIGAAVQSVRIAAPFEADLHLLRAHLRTVQEDINRIGV